MKIDGYARVVTNSNGDIVYVHDSHFDHDKLTQYIGSSEIIDMISYINTRDSEVLLPLTYYHSEGGYSGGTYHDPDEGLHVVTEYVLKPNHKEWLINEIQDAIRKEEKLTQDIQSHDTLRHYSDLIGDYSSDLIEFYQAIYNEKFE